MTGGFLGFSMLAIAAAALLIFLVLGISALRDLDAMERRFALLDREHRLRRTRFKIFVALAIAGGAAAGAVLVAAVGAAEGGHKAQRLAQELSAAQRGLFQLEHELTVVHAPPAAADTAPATAPVAKTAPAAPAAADQRIGIRSSGEVKVRAVANGSVIASLYPGAMVYLVAGAPTTHRGENDWRQVRLPDGRVGWIAVRFLDLPPAEAAAGP